MARQKVNVLQNDTENYVINGNFDIWQRGFTGATGYIADRFLAGGGVESYTRQTASPPEGSRWYARFARTTASVASVEVVYRMEQFVAKDFVGKTMTLSFLAKSASSTFNINARAGAPTVTDNFAAMVFTAEAGLGNLTTGWTKYSLTFDVTTDMVERGLQFNIGTYTVSGPVEFDLAQVQLNVGDFALPFKSYGKDFEEELSACQRYYQRHDFAGFAYRRPQNETMTINYPVPLRVTPTISYNLEINDAGGATFGLVGNTYNSFTGILPATVGSYDLTLLIADAELY